MEVSVIYLMPSLSVARNAISDLRNGSIYRRKLHRQRKWPQHQDWELIRKLESTFSTPAHPILVACVWNFYEVAQASLTHDMEAIKKKNSQNEPCINLCCRNGSFEVASLLIQHQVQITSINTWFGPEDPLQIACRAGHRNIVDLLLT
jgi:hypothetical protein